jgi:hypothetical protein
MRNRFAMLMFTATCALAPLAASADLSPMATAELRAINGQGGTSLIYNPPPVVKRLDQAAVTLDQYGFHRAAQVVQFKAGVLYFILSPCGRPGVYC